MAAHATRMAKKHRSMRLFPSHFFSHQEVFRLCTSLIWTFTILHQLMTSRTRNITNTYFIRDHNGSNGPHKFQWIAKSLMLPCVVGGADRHRGPAAMLRRQLDGPYIWRELQSPSPREGLASNLNTLGARDMFRRPKSLKPLLAAATWNRTLLLTKQIW